MVIIDLPFKIILFSDRTETIFPKKVCV